jgi:hypothetical protein
MPYKCLGSTAPGSIDEVVADEHLLPSGNKIDVDVIGDVEIAIHAQKAGKRSVN